MRNTVLALLAVICLLFNSCGLFLGPLSDISLQQRLLSGWKTVHDFTFLSPVSFPSLGSSKLLLARVPNEIRGYYLIEGASIRHVFFFNTNSSSNVVALNLIGTMPNKIDISYDRTNCPLMYFNNMIYKFDNDTLLSWSPFMLSSSINILIAEGDYIIGAYDMMSRIVRYRYQDSASSNVTILPDATSIGQFLNKCRNKYNNDTVIRAMYFNGVAGESQIQMFAANNPQNFLLSAPYSMTNMIPVMESDGGNKLYMLHGKTFYRYNGTSKSFDQDYQIPYSLPIGDTNFVAVTGFIGDNFIVLHHNAMNPGNPILFWSYNTSAKTFTEILFQETATNEQVIGLDMYYDPDSYALYLGVIYFQPSSGNLHVKMYVNQF